ncbi:MAG: malate dehydrogenase [Rickettsiaceae bacterium]|jgi:malate/lactate dehydrogenase|nr:malate dehydrogenase [Rickettsiaceae bacterium]
MSKSSLVQPVSANPRILSIIGAGDIGKSVLDAILRIFPRDEAMKVILLNRNQEKAQVAYLEAALNEQHFTQSVRNRGPNIEFKATSNPQDLKDSELIIFTAGISATTLGSSNREFALPFVYRMIIDYAKLIKEYAPSSSIFIITNPSDIATLIIQRGTGFAPDRVVGFGCELDARRFLRALREELENVGIFPKTLDADVIGGHSEDKMIVPQNSIIIDGVKLVDFKLQHPDQESQIDLALKNADNSMRKEGFRIVKSGGKAHIAPAISLAVASRSFMFGPEYSMTGAQVLTNERQCFGIDSSCVSVPIIIGKKKVELDRDKYQLNCGESSELRSVSEKHQTLFNNIKLMSDEFLKRIENGRKEMEEAKERMDLAQQTYLKGLANMQKRFDKITRMMFKLESGSGNSGYSKLRLRLKPAIIDSTSEKGDRISLLQDTAEYLKDAAGIECDINEEEESLLLPGSQVSIRMLEKIGLTKSAITRSKL